MPHIFMTDKVLTAVVILTTELVLAALVSACRGKSRFLPVRGDI